MHNTNRPGAHVQMGNRAGECVLGGTLPHTTPETHPQSRIASVRLVGWRVTRFLTVEGLEVKHG